jgi:hypothetical protein
MIELIITKKDIQSYLDESHATPHERNVAQTYIAAIEKNDVKILELFNGFGPSVRHRIMNMHSYICNLKFGFTYTDLGEYNWLKRPEWETEIFDLGTKHSRYADIKIGKSPNGKWTYGWSFNYGFAGSGSPLSTFSTPFDSREKCIDAALNYAKTEYSKGLSKPSDDGNYNPDIIKATLKVIDSLFVNTVQLSMF